MTTIKLPSGIEFVMLAKGSTGTVYVSGSTVLKFFGDDEDYADEIKIVRAVEAAGVQQVPKLINLPTQLKNTIEFSIPSKFIAYDYAGEPLYKVYRSMSLNVRISTLRQLVTFVFDYASMANLAHMDLKEDNVLYNFTESRIAICDLGTSLQIGSKMFYDKRERDPPEYSSSPTVSVAGELWMVGKMFQNMEKQSFNDKLLEYEIEPLLNTDPATREEAARRKLLKRPREA